MLTTLLTILILSAIGYPLITRKLTQIKTARANNPSLQTLKLLVNLYHGIESEKVSQADREHLKLQDDAYTYGEIDFISFIKLLEKTNIKPSDTFYDLGSGAGKAVLTAALNFNLEKAIGIEYLPQLCELTHNRIETARDIIKTDYPNHAERFTNNLNHIQIINANFLDYDFSDADIIFINATCLSHTTWEKLQEKFQQLKPSTRLITTTKKITLPQFQPLYQGLELMSWGMSSVNIYIKG